MEITARQCALGKDGLYAFHLTLMEITARNKSHSSKKTTSADHEDTKKHSMQTKGLKWDGKLVTACRSLFRTILYAGITCLMVLRTNRYLQFIIVAASLTLLLIHIYCFPADCDDPFFIPRTSKQFPLEYSYAHDAGKLCAVNKEGGDAYTEIDVVILVLTMSQNVQERQAIRQTYGSVWKGAPWPGTDGENELEPPGGTVRVVFLMGQTKDATYRAREAELVAAESRVHGDMVQWDGLLEDYTNLTLKVLLGLRWVRDWCPRAKHVVKTDDDIFIHLPRLFSHLRVTDSGSNYIHGMHASCHVTGRKGKYASTYDTYPLPSRPVHVKGAIYAMGRELALHLLSVSTYIPFDNMEDVFMTGTLACVVGARHAGLSARQYNGCGPVTNKCDFLDGYRLAAKTNDPKIFHDIWRTFSKPDLCSGIYTMYAKVLTYFRPSFCIL